MRAKGECQSNLLPLLSPSFSSFLETLHLFSSFSPSPLLFPFLSPFLSPLLFLLLYLPPLIVVKEILLLPFLSSSPFRLQFLSPNQHPLLSFFLFFFFFLFLSLSLFFSLLSSFSSRRGVRE